MLIIDSHCHYGKGDGLTGPWDSRASLKRYIQRARQAGIQKTAVWSVFHSDYVKANRQVASLIKRYPNRFFGFLFVHPQRDRNRIKSMAREFIGKQGFVGIKVHRHDGPINRAVCEAAKAWKVPVVYDVRDNMSGVEMLAREYPGVNFIFPHLGSFRDDFDTQIALIDHLVRHPNFYTDTSGVRRFDNLLLTLKRAGAKKILFGSDGPWLHPGLELAKIHALPLSYREKELILGGNFLRLIQSSRRFVRVS